jgi:phosphatidylserine/phosphatidylglycerophosphate/cardiolipin synthase-like enzyme
VDGRIAFVGGLDMTDFDVDRWDTQRHAVREGLNWHDLCLRLEGAAAADVGRNFIQRWQAVTGEKLTLPESAEPESVGTAPVQIVRTLPAKDYPFSPKGEFGIAWAYRQAFRAARSFIYIENQYLWSPAVANELIAALKRVDDPDFRIVLVLPARPNIGKGDTDTHIEALRDADKGRGRVQVFSLYTSALEEEKKWIYKPIYVHAKVTIIDDAWFTVGSANLNQRGLEGDSELNAQVLDARLAQELRLRLWSEHLGLPRETIATLTPAQAIDQLWVPLGTHVRQVIDDRSGPLRTAVVHYRKGGMPGDLSLGELEARLLDG